MAEGTGGTEELKVSSSSQKLVEAAKKGLEEHLKAAFPVAHEGGDTAKPDTNKAKRDAAITVATGVLQTALTTHFGNKRFKDGVLNIEQVTALAKEIADAQQAMDEKADKTKIELDTNIEDGPLGPPSIVKLPVSDRIVHIAIATVQEELVEAKKKIQAYATYDATAIPTLGDISDEFEKEATKKALRNGAEDALDAHIKLAKALREYNKKVEALFKDIPDDKRAELQAAAKGVVAPTVAAIEARFAYVEAKEAFEARKKAHADNKATDKGTFDEKPPEETAAKDAEEAAKKAFEAANKDGDKARDARHKELIEFMLRAELNAKYTAEKDLKDKFDKAKSTLGIGDLKKLVDAAPIENISGLHRDAKPSQGGAKETMKNLKSNGGKLAGGAALTVLAGAVMAKGGSDEVNQETGEKKGMGFWGKVACTIGLVVGIGMIVSAARDGNFKEGFDKAGADGQSWVSKVAKGTQTYLGSGRA